MPVGTYGTVKAMSPERAARRSARRSCSATPSTSGCGPGLEVIGKHGGLHRFMGWKRPDPHRLGRLPGVQPGRAAQDQRGGRAASPRPSTATALLLTPEESMRIQQRARLRHRHGVRRVHRLSRDRRARPRDSMRLSHALGRALAATRYAGNRMRCSASCRAACTRHLRDESLARADRASASTATRSAASRWASPRRSARASLAHIAPRMPAGAAALPDGRGHARGHRRGGRRGHRHVRLRAADAQRAQRLAVHALRRRQASATRATATTRRRSTRDCACYTCRNFTPRLPAPPAARPTRSSARASTRCTTCTTTRS